MGEIEFTQYMRPSGRTEPATIERSDEIAKMADRVNTFGGAFEMEVLTTGEVSLTVQHNDEDIAIEIVPNGPDVPDAVDRLVRSAVEILAPTPEE